MQYYWNIKQFVSSGPSIPYGLHAFQPTPPFLLQSAPDVLLCTGIQDQDIFSLSTPIDQGKSAEGSQYSFTVMQADKSTKKGIYLINIKSDDFTNLPNY